MAVWAPFALSYVSLSWRLAYVVFEASASKVLELVLPFQDKDRAFTEGECTGLTRLKNISGVGRMHVLTDLFFFDR